MFDKFFYLHSLTADELRSNGECIGNFSTALNNSYSVWIMERGRWGEVLVLIHEKDQEVAGILESKTGKILYLHPRSLDGAMKLWNI